MLHIKDLILFIFLIFFCVCVWLSLYLSFLKTSPNLVHDWNILVLVRLQSVINYVFYLGLNVNITCAD